MHFCLPLEVSRLQLEFLSLELFLLFAHNWSSFAYSWIFLTVSKKKHLNKLQVEKLNRKQEKFQL